MSVKLSASKFDIGSNVSIESVVAPAPAAGAGAGEGAGTEAGVEV